ncbi:hypothetical protein [Williamsoniiplasma lucivorax]|uniref:Uncharacterized protein n=1 Tax=Williamsoniiplasma lucivorax TaxID=209274 RepID=A0A2S5R9V7_9MOLU|nr:hypothetical protein [Williamsoniiplasma lucivorax]PPE04111.1 hypothetical protein ELUCI_v1c08910 [Williamsoniiplasma lucivorax]
MRTCSLCKKSIQQWHLFIGGNRYQKHLGCKNKFRALMKPAMIVFMVFIAFAFILTMIAVIPSLFGVWLLVGFLSILTIIVIGVCLLIAILSIFIGYLVIKIKVKNQDYGDDCFDDIIKKTIKNQNELLANQLQQSKIIIVK